MDTKTTDISKYFSLEALEAILKACQFAHEKGQRVCTTAHLFKTLLANPSIQQLFTLAKMDFSKIFIEVDTILRHISYPIKIKKDSIEFSPDLKRTILRAYLISTKIVTELVEIEDMLISCLNSSEVSPLLKNFGINISSLEEIIISRKGGYIPTEDLTSTITTRFTTNLTDLAKEGQLGEILNREKELAQLMRILVRKTKNNVILLGEVGVGRKSVIHLLAKKIATGEVAPQIQNFQILELNLSGLLSAVAIRDISKLTEMLGEELRGLGNTILFLPNMENISQDSSVESTLISNMLTSLLIQGNYRIASTMTPASYRQLQAKEKEIAERFETIKVSEPAKDLALKILESVARRLSQHHQIQINKEAIQTSVSLSERYIQDKFLPSKAIDILDEASSKVVLENRLEVTPDDIRSVISEKTGVPIEKLTVSEQSKLINLEQTLNQTVIGQREAVHIVSEVIRRSRAGLKDPKKPIGSFLFLGPSGVGKTFLAKNLARIVYDNENAMIRLDMSEFSESHTVQRLIGSPPGYVGYEEGGQLTNPIWERPYSLILLDEIEKAHPKVFDIFLQVLDEGHLSDGQGRTVDFKNTIIIATSNIATDEILKKLSKRGKEVHGFDRERFFEEEIIPILKQYFRPEFINRFDEIVVFDPLDIHELAKIAELQIQEIQKRLVDKNITLKVSPQKLTEFAQKSYNPAFGARPLIRLIQDQVENVLARKIIAGEIKEGETVNL